MQKSELQFFKSLLTERKEQILNNITATNSELSLLHSCELNDEGHHACTLDNVRLDSTLILKQQKELHEIEHALGKISNGSYGCCEMCDDDIGFARLKVKPHAHYCIVCRPIVEKNSSVTL
jgi:RNA polymerase-binding transcription factor